jgi:ElaB/YqjD/DUF883 family membrane-anchored ribosome-binding protein
MIPSVTSKDDTVHSLKNSASNIRDDIRAGAGEGKDDLAATAANAGRKVRSFISSTSDELSHASEAVTTHVHAKPMQSTLIALGVGYVLGMLFRR